MKSWKVKIKNMNSLSRGERPILQQNLERIVCQQTAVGLSHEFQTKIDNPKAIELEALFEKYCALKEMRVRSFGKKLIALEKELERRSLEDIPTEKLFHLIVKYADSLKQECVVLRFQKKEFLPEVNLDDKTIGWEG